MKYSAQLMIKAQKLWLPSFIERLVSQPGGHKRWKIGYPTTGRTRSAHDETQNEGVGRVPLQTTALRYSERFALIFLQLG